MDKDERLSPALQENILILLCFNDKSCKTIRAAVGTPKLFETKIYREIAGAAMDFIDSYGRAPGEHIADEFEEVTDGDDKLKAEQYSKLLKKLFTARESVNEAYVLGQLHKFVRLQGMKSALIASVEAADAGDIERVEVLWQAALKAQVTSFEGGLSLNDPTKAGDFLDEIEEPLLTGIPALDKYGVGPSRKTVFLVMAPLKRGKSWMLMHLGKWANLQRKTVVHVTLEMSESKTKARYYQNYFGITKRDAFARVAEFSRNRDGTMSDIVYRDVDTLAMNDPDIRAKLAKEVRRSGLERRPPLIIKGFPSGSLTLAGLEAYLDGLERFQGIIPDVLIIDYAELMQIGGKDSNDRRASIGKLFVELRGLADARNLALITASQTNRGGIAKKTSTEEDLAEDLSKGFTVDTIVTYNQTQAEYKLGLARLFVAAHRDDEGRQTALITQSYKMGQFCVDSIEVPTRYWEDMERRERRGSREGDEDDR